MFANLPNIEGFGEWAWGRGTSTGDEDDAWGRGASTGDEDDAWGWGIAGVMEMMHGEEEQQG